MKGSYWNPNEMSMQEKKTVIEQRLIENKGKDELCDYLREQLTDCGWKEDLKVYCKGNKIFRTD